MGICPYCNGQVDFKNIKKEKEGVGFWKQETIYICPHCNKILGFSRGKYTG